MWLGHAFCACFEDRRAIITWTMSEELLGAFLPWHGEGDGGYGFGTLTGDLEKPQSQGWPEQGAGSQPFASTCTLTLHVRSALAHVGFPLCPEGPGARTCKARQLLHGCNPSLPQEWVCPQAEAAAAYPQTQQDSLWVTSAPKMVWLNQLFQCTSYISALSQTPLTVSAQAFVVVLRKSPEEGLNSSRGCTMVKHIGKGWPSPNPLLQCTMEVTWGGKRCSQGRI